MNSVYVISAKRTPFGSFGGQLADMPAPQLAAEIIKDILLVSNLAAGEVKEVILGQVLTGGAGQAPARQAMRFAGLPDAVPAMTINKVCGSGLKAIMLGAQAILTDEADVVVAGGMENMSGTPYALPGARFGFRLGAAEARDMLVYDALTDPYSGRHMGELTEELIASYGITRKEQDAYASQSYKRAQKAVNEGIFSQEIVPVKKTVKSKSITVEKDEEPFRVQFEKIDSLRPVFMEDGTITAANASTINDGAAVALLAGEEAVRRHSLRPIARLVASVTHSIDPARFAEAPVGAIEKACAKAGLGIADIGLFEVNEAFAAVPLMAIRQLGLDQEKVNVNGGAVSIGHPVGASGGRLVATLLREMQKRGERYGMATLCIGGGEAVAAIFERV